jgi:hypothetical protein
VFPFEKLMIDSLAPLGAEQVRNLKQLSAKHNNNKKITKAKTLSRQWSF